ncbi:MAG: alpha/beta fold hydrolase [Acidimicrobiia bacterium]
MTVAESAGLGPRLDVGGLTINFEDVGDGPPVLVLNGLGASSDMLAGFRRSLARKRRVITFDVPGVGESEPWRRPATMVDYVDLTLEVMDHLELQRVDLTGYSWGGVLAQALAIHRPQRFDHLVLISTGTGATTIPGHPIVPFILTNHARYVSPRLLRLAAPMMYGGDIRRPKNGGPRLEGLWTAHPPTPRGYLGQLTALWGYTSLPSLRAIPHPTLLLTGTDDPIAHHLNTRLMGRMIRNSTVEIIPEAGHLVPVTRPEQTASRVERFLSGANSEGEDT